MLLTWLALQRSLTTDIGIRYGSFPFVSQPHGSESDYQNVDFLTFINPEHVIYDIGTEILYETCDGHNSTQNAPKSIIPEDSKSAGHFP